MKTGVLETWKKKDSLAAASDGVGHFYRADYRQL